MNGWKPLVAIVGATAVGKSRVGVQVAKALGTEVLTADSRQVYRGMDIGTDKPPWTQREGVPHRLIDLVEPDERFDVGSYRRMALAEIDRLQQAHRIPLVVGGTGLYVRALVRGLWEGPSADWRLRERLMEEEQAKGLGHLHRKLARVDPELASRLHPRDGAKIIRGLEVYLLTGRPLSGLHQRHGVQDRPFSPLLIGLLRDRQALYRRIEERVDFHLSKGLLAETERLVRAGYGRHLGSMKGLGYRHMASYLAGEYAYAEAVRLCKRDTRHFAKRQLTWFRKEDRVKWILVEESEPVDRVADRILAMIEDYAAPRRRPPSGRTSSATDAVGGIPAAG